MYCSQFSFFIMIGNIASHTSGCPNTEFISEPRQRGDRTRLATWRPHNCNWMGRWCDINAYHYISKKNTSRVSCSTQLPKNHFTYVGMISCWLVDGRNRPTSIFSNNSQHNASITILKWNIYGKRLITGDKVSSTHLKLNFYDIIVNLSFNSTFCTIERTRLCMVCRCQRISDSYKTISQKRRDHISCVLCHASSSTYRHPA